MTETDNKLKTDILKIIDISDTKEDIKEHLNLYFELKSLNRQTQEILVGGLK